MASAYVKYASAERKKKKSASENLVSVPALPSLCRATNFVVEKPFLKVFTSLAVAISNVRPLPQNSARSSLAASSISFVSPLGALSPGKNF